MILLDLYSSLSEYLFGNKTWLKTLILYSINCLKITKMLIVKINLIFYSKALKTIISYNIIDNHFFFIYCVHYCFG